jgi:phosphoenolpyruvate carboxykinase (ATP)
MYHFLSGYTAKVAGTEKGVKEPQATFSTCFGAPFMPRHPSVYGKLLAELMNTHGVNCWLVNTGWSGGAYGEGARMEIKYTRAMVNAALSGELDHVDYITDANFGVRVPATCPNVPDAVLQPRNTWRDPAAYDAQAKHLVALFEENFKQFAAHVDDKVNDAAIRAA